MDKSPLSSSRPYIIRALYEWVVDNNCTPYLLVDAERVGVQVPRQFVKDGQIVLNISPTAVMNLQLKNDCVFFDARFSGVSMQVNVPMPAILGIYARENGQGMMFDPNEQGFESESPEIDPPDNDPKSTPPRGNKKTKAERPSLKIVK
jgi:stringent starvation protein B